MKSLVARFTSTAEMVASLAVYAVAELASGLAAALQRAVARVGSALTGAGEQRR